MFVRGTVEYAGELSGLMLPKTTFPGRVAPVSAVEASCDGTNARVIVFLGPVQSEAAAVLAAEDETLRVWAAILVALPDYLSDVSPPVRRAVRLEAQPHTGVGSLRGESMVRAAGTGSLQATPPPCAIQAVQQLAAAPSWDPSASRAYGRYAAALKESDPALQFLALYGAALEAIRIKGREPHQEDLDDELGRTFGIARLPSHNRDRRETPFTRARNRLLHPVDRGVKWENAKSYAADQFIPFRKIVAALVRR
jgi:hypothetical protein